MEDRNTGRWGDWSDQKTCLKPWCWSGMYLVESWKHWLEGGCLIPIQSLTLSNNRSGQQWLRMSWRSPVWKFHSYSVWRAAALLYLSAFFFLVAQFKTPKLWFVTMSSFCTICNNLLSVRWSKPGSFSFSQGTYSRLRPSEQLFAGPPPVSSNLFWAWQPKIGWRIPCAASACQVEEDSNFPWSAATFILMNTGQSVVCLFAMRTCHWLTLSLASTVTPGFFAAGLLLWQLVLSLCWCSGLFSPGAKLCLSPCWTAWGFCWPKPQVSQGLSRLNFYCLVFDPFPIIQCCPQICKSCFLCH